MAVRADDVDLGRDRALVVRFQAGDETAFEDLYRRYFTRLRRYCERRVGDPHEAEEVAQEAFVRALRAMPGFAGERRFYPWMTVIASRLCVDSHRRRQRSTPVPDVDGGSVEADLDALFAEVDRAQLTRALDRLAPRHREVLTLREHDGWTYQRIADHYDVTLGTVEALLHRARRALRREFEKVTAVDRMRALAGVPAGAWLMRRFGSLRTRAAAFGDLASPLSAAVASVAIAAGSVAIVDGRTTNRPSPVPAAVVRVVAPRLASSVVTMVDSTPPPAPPLERAAPTGSAPAPDHRTPPAAVTVARADDGRSRTVEAPVRHDVDGVGGAGVDPAAAVAAVVDRVDPLLRRNP